MSKLSTCTPEEMQMDEHPILSHSKSLRAALLRSPGDNRPGPRSVLTVMCRRISQLPLSLVHPMYSVGFAPFY